MGKSARKVKRHQPVLQKDEEHLCGKSRASSRALSPRRICWGHCVNRHLLEQKSRRSQLVFRVTVESVNMGQHGLWSYFEIRSHTYQLFILDSETFALCLQETELVICEKHIAHKKEKWRTNNMRVWVSKYRTTACTGAWTLSCARRNGAGPTEWERTRPSLRWQCGCSLRCSDRGIGLSYFLNLLKITT